MSEQIPVRQFSPANAIYVRAQKGLYQRLRRYGGWFLLLLFAGLPWLRWGDRQALLLDIGERQFHFFGLTIWPQDLILLVFLLAIAAFGLFFVTTFLGRVWCGYTCPQTVWTFIYIWFEEKLEGSANKRKKLDQSPWNFNKLWRKTAKHIAWLVVALLTAMIMVSYFVDARLVFSEFFSGQLGFSANFCILFFTLATYGNAGWMRTIVCTHMCPYARFQSAMFDKDTFIVGYDTERGEARGPRRRKEDHKAKGLGDCVDCHLCVQVCPAGIDIRQGLQYECINCGACVDACDETMHKWGYQPGLISYTTEHKLQGGKTDIFRPKLLGYGAVLLLMCGLFVASLLTRVDFDLNVQRDRNQLFRLTDEGLVENTYILTVLNKSQHSMRYQLDQRGLEAEWQGPRAVEVAPGELFTLPISLAVDPYLLTQPITDFEFVLTPQDGSEREQLHESRFINQVR